MTARLAALLRALALAAAMLAASRAAAALAPDQLAAVGFNPPPRAALPLDAPLTDLDGRNTTLGAAMTGKPSVVVFADYDCPELCSPVLALTGAALVQSGLEPSGDYRLIVIGLNPRASAADGRRMIREQIGFSTPIGRATTAVTASEPMIARLAAAVGYSYAYDTEHRRYAHPVALFVVASDGRLSRVLSGLAISGADVRLALVEAGKGAIGGIADQIHLLCYGFGAAVGDYNNRVRVLLAAASAATLLAILGGLMMLSRIEARRRA
ncbi:MAG: SCO family protein [Hyphomicrobiales bacterium]|nr:SCO family protein [Hyphomicrobiales bacterium]